MDLARDVRGVIRDQGSFVELTESGGETRTVFMVCLKQYTGGNTPSMRRKLMDWADSSSMPTGASYGYGLLMASDAPEGMDEKTKLTLTDSLGQSWRTDAAGPIVDRKQDGTLEVVAWRLLLRGTQRGMR